MALPLRAMPMSCAQTPSSVLPTHASAKPKVLCTHGASVVKHAAIVVPKTSMSTAAHCRARGWDQWHVLCSVVGKAAVCIRCHATQCQQRIDWHHGTAKIKGPSDAFLCLWALINLTRSIVCTTRAAAPGIKRQRYSVENVECFGGKGPLCTESLLCGMGLKHGSRQREAKGGACLKDMPVHHARQPS